MSETLTLPVLPLDDEVVLPGMVVPLDLSTAEVRRRHRGAPGCRRRQVPGMRSEDKPRVLLVPRLDAGYAGVGTLAVVEQVGRLPGGEPGAVVRGVARVRIGAGTTGPGAALWVEGTVIEETDRRPRAPRSWPRSTRPWPPAMLQQRGAWQVVDVVQQIDDPSALADSAGYAPYLTTEQKVRAAGDRRPGRAAGAGDRLGPGPPRRAGRRRDHPQGRPGGHGEAAARVPAAPAARRGPQGAGRAERRRPGTEEEDYRARVEAADLPEKVREAALKEVDKLERTSDQSPEGGWIRTWLDTVLEMPWNERTEDAYDIAGARQILDADHAGLDDVKERIIEYLAVRKRRADRGLGVVGGRRSGAVLALVGPPGVGKTSLGESVARAMGRKFVRVALGGVRDEAEIRGHRRTYVGALPGRIVRAITRGRAR